jgi:Family of unknown function (DUF5749)
LFIRISLKIYNKDGITGSMVLRVSGLLFTLECVDGVFFFNRNKEIMQQKKTPENADTSMICKFVIDGTGKKIGESVSIDDDILIIKSGSRFLGVPMKHVEPLEKTLVVKGLIDFTKAYELGEKWRKDSYREMNQYDLPAEKSKRF